MSDAKHTTMENEKAAIKRSMAHEARFREEKQRIVESMGGSGAELTVTPCSDNTRIQRKLAKNTAEGSARSSLLSTSQRSTRGAFQASSSSRSSTSTPRKSENISGGSSLLLSTDSSATGFQTRDDDPEQAVPRGDLPRALAHTDEHYNYGVEERRRESRKFSKKNTCYIVAAVILVIAIGGIVGVVVAFAKRSASPTGGTDSSATGGSNMCELDREALVTQCENGVLAVPDCAADSYQELVDTYSGLLVGTEQECDVAHQGLVALAVSQTNHGGDVEDPMLFFAMSTLFFALKGTQWRLDRNWLEGSSPCGDSWYGIECYPGGSIISVSLENNGLKGFLPTEVGLLSNLRDLGIGLNEISGTIPSEVGLLANKLQTFDFHFTSIHSELPSEIGMLTELTNTRFSHAPLTGPIPSEIGNLSKLKKLELAVTHFTGTLPTELGNLVGLEYLRLADLDGITGAIPSTLVALTGLTHFDIELYGVDPTPFPEVLSVATNLTFVHLRKSGVKGSIPTTILNLQRLRKLILSQLEIEESIPTEVGLLSNLVKLKITHSMIEGTIPSELGLLTKLNALEITDMVEVSGTVPSELGALTALELLNFKSTDLRGTIPAEVCALGLPRGKIKFDICGEPGSDMTCVWNTCGV